jgi:VWFA-related protein
MRSITATLLAWVLIVSAQQAPRPQAQAQTAAPKGGFRFEANATLVIETLSLKDKGGKPIEGLKASDFVVVEDGKQQTVKFCEYQKLENEATADTTPKVTVAAAPPKAAPAAPAKETAAAAPASAPAEADKPVVKSITANQIAPEKPGDIKYKDRRLMVLFFDMTSMPIDDQIRAQGAAQKFLKTQMTQSDLVAIMSFSNDIHVVEDFTDDRDQLAKDIKALTIGEGQGFGEANSDDSSADTGAAFTADDSEFNIFNTDRQLSALETAAKMLGALNEKKALVYFASGLQANGVDNQAQMQATINAAIRANVSFYPIDARGLVASAPLGDATKGSPGGSAMYSGSSARAATNNFQKQQESMFTLAADTGGKALLDNTDLAMGIVQAQKDISSYYIIGYTPTNDKLDGQFRRVKITLRPELAGKYGQPRDYRQGYYAGKEFGKFTTTDKERQLQQALMLGDPVTDIEIALDYYYFRLAKDRYFVPVVAKIPGSELELAKHGGADTTRIEFIGEVKDAAGKVVQNVRDSVDIKLKGENVGNLSKSPVEYDTGFILAPGTYSLKFLARDNETGKMGTYDRKFIIPDLTTQQTTLPISKPVLSSQRTDLTAAVYTAQKDKKLLEANPLVESGTKLIPSVTNVFSRAKDLYVYLQAYEPTAETTQPLIATVSFMRGKVKAFETAPLQVTEGLDPKSKAVPLKFSVPLGKLAPGRYTCQVNVLDPNGQKFAFWRAPVMLVQ